MIDKAGAGSYNLTAKATDDGGDGTTSDPVNITVTGAGGGTMHVDSITVAIVKVNRVSNKAQAIVVVKDNLGVPVSGATVTGTFSGVVTGTVTATTDENGTAILNSAKKKGLSSATFCVDNVTHASLVYDPADNVETCDSTP